MTWSRMDEDVYTGLHEAALERLRANGFPPDEEWREIWRKIHALDERREEAAPPCPGCGASIFRQKCLFEMGGDCPRHEVKNGWKAALGAGDS